MRIAVWHNKRTLAWHQRSGVKWCVTRIDIRNGKCEDYSSCGTHSVAAGALRLAKRHLKKKKKNMAQHRRRVARIPYDVPSLRHQTKHIRASSKTTRRSRGSEISGTGGIGVNSVWHRWRVSRAPHAHQRNGARWRYQKRHGGSMRGIMAAATEQSSSALC